MRKNIYRIVRYSHLPKEEEPRFMHEENYAFAFQAVARFRELITKDNGFRSVKEYDDHHGEGAFNLDYEGDIKRGSYLIRPSHYKKNDFKHTEEYRLETVNVDEAKWNDTAIDCSSEGITDIFDHFSRIRFMKGLSSQDRETLKLQLKGYFGTWAEGE